MHRTKSYLHLRCPDDHSELTLANEELVQQLNAAIKAGKVTNRGGRPIVEHVTGALVRSTGGIIYPIVHGIPLLLRDEAISLDQLR